MLLLPIGSVALMLGFMVGWLNRPVLSQGLTQPGSITVTQTGDSGPGSLRAAILEANSQPGTDHISIVVTGTLQLLSPLPEITDEVAISGPGASLFRIDGDSTHQLLKFASTTLTVTGVTLQRGANLVTGGRGGAVQGVGTLYLGQTHILSNSAQSHGGALHVLGTLTLDQVVVRNNQSQTATGGAAFVSGTTIVTGSQFFENHAQQHGGVIYSLGTMSIANSDFGDNYCANSGCNGGALFGFPETTVDHVTMTDNVAGYNGGAANLLGVLTMTNSLLQGNRTLNNNGGALFGQDYAYISHSQFLGNVAQYQGGGMYMLGDLTMIDSEIAGNDSGHYGGGLIVYGGLTVSRTAFIRNEGLRGGGLYQ
ncbi:MAG: hypothetical protein KDE59_12495, partial [Anaerolineales bacterium]|nr:hypothetical protein [Anaerolineales bacterium]